MINVKKRRKKSVWIGEIFLPDLFRFCGQKRLLRVWTFFFGQQEQGKNDSFLEGALLSRRRLNENAYYILHVFVAPGKERTKEIANEKKTTKKKKRKTTTPTVYMTVSLRS
jgi:hypothetical protein